MRTDLFHLRHALAKLREIEPSMTIVQAQVLMEIATSPKITTRDIATRLNLNTGAMSRIVSLLAEDGARGKPGVGLIRREREERKKGAPNPLRLTARGERVAQALVGQ